MAVSVSYPGVYIQELPSGARAIAGVGTSIALFVGMAPLGPMNKPVFISSFADYNRRFGDRGASGELGDQVYMFFLNGGAQAYVMRIADGEQEADVTLMTETGAAAALTLTARDPGNAGNMIRAEVDYGTSNPERTFNLTVFRRVLQPDGTYSRENEEPTYLNLSMDPASVDYVETRINGVSDLVEVTATTTAPASTVGKSISGVIFNSAGAAAINTEIGALIAAGTNQLRVSVNNLPAQQITVRALGTLNDTLNSIADDIVAAYSGAVALSVNDASGAASGVTNGRLIWLECPDGPVTVQPASGGDISVPLQLGAHAGGVEGDGYSMLRPAPTGGTGRMGAVDAASASTFVTLRNFAAADRANLQTITIDDSRSSPQAVTTGVATPGLLYEGTAPTLTNAMGSLANVRAALDVMVAAINAQADWTAERHGLRLSLNTDRNGVAGDNALTVSSNGTDSLGGVDFPFDSAASEYPNVTAYSLGLLNGSGGTGDYQNQPGNTSNEGLDGTAPLSADYDEAYALIEKEVDLFNLLITPFATGQTESNRTAIRATTTAFAARKRAFALVDPPPSWTDIDAAYAGIDTLRIGLETRNSACFWPRLRIADPTLPNGRVIDPAGAIAGLAARTDSRFGVWKAPAGIEATLRGVIGLSAPMSDVDNGRINPKALNALRIFPAGVVSWGARTLVGFNSSGNIDDKYIPVRRTQLFIEESLSRGLKFAVFQPNGADLWAQIRLAAGSFMSGLFQQGAFAGTKESDAFFVVCDASTTTPTDINLGIVNVLVGFAPLKPAEFVVVQIQQIAGQASA
ncbi:phage tail sheath subtilisin-like domain-containing protein [Roseovarius sp. D22-M7]|uniref:phage tail sheath subtilisin-like domain-containing protein n=1 Tax=Roseovarius sp. D22-M7 TaxID=3127116 RepID=UPI00300F7F9B